MHVDLVGKHLLHAVFDVLEDRHEGLCVIVLPLLMRSVCLRLPVPQSCWISRSEKGKQEIYVAKATGTRPACAMRLGAASAMVAVRNDKKNHTHQSGSATRGHAATITEARQK